MAKDKGKQKKVDDTFEFGGEMPATEALNINPAEAKSSTEKQLSNAVIRAGGVIFDPYSGTKKTKSIEDQMAQVEDDWESGRLTNEQAMQALENVYTVNHSVGRDILYDRRLKPRNRVLRYTAYAMAHGLHGGNRSEAEKFAISELVKQHKIAGNWGTVTENIDIREIE